jgi:hypothetical protein
MIGIRNIAVVLSLLVSLTVLGGCGQSSNATSAVSASTASTSANSNKAFELSAAGVSGELPNGWQALGAACRSQGLCRIVIAGSFPVNRDSGTFRSVPAGKVYVQIYEHPDYAHRASASPQFRRWLRHHYPQRDSTTFALSDPSRLEGGWGFNIFFQEYNRPLQALVLTHGSKLSDEVKLQTKEFLNSLEFESLSPGG